ncbi:MAG: prepilin peptidase [Patescibacteria group bacterium]|nr:prepilin peptidase [Patescibacteria group bacterium]MBU2068449.1 prepilin peptidase [Patescibacteria group bacterium]
MFFFIIFLFGLAIGSFLNVVICRLETKESILVSRSYCPKCKKSLKWFELIPIFSFLIQKGKCRYCGKKISIQYPLVELATGLLFLFVILNYSSVIPNLIGNPDLINFRWIPAFAGMTFNLIIISLLIVIFVYDLKHYIIPDKIVYPAIIIAGIFNFQFSIFNEFSIFKLSILSALGASGFFLSLVLISKGKWMGLGDVKLAFLMGLILGWPNIFIALFLSFAFGAIIGLILIAFKKKGLKSEIPFGPFLISSTLMTMFYSQNLINWYQDLFSVFIF